LRIRDVDRSGNNNLYGRYKKVRMTTKEKNANLEMHLHPDLVDHPRVSIEKYSKFVDRRGLAEHEAPFP
jgi:hypothetical protein